MVAVTDAAIDAFGKNGQVKKRFRALFTGLARIVPAQVPDPVISKQVIPTIAGV